MPASNATALPRAAPYDAAATGGGGAGGGGEVDPDVVASIADILPHLPRARIRDALEAHGGSFDRALEYLMSEPADEPDTPDASPSAHAAGTMRDFDAAVQQLSELFADRPRDELFSILQARRRCAPPRFVVAR